MQKKVTLLGATGSIGDSALDILCANPDRFAVETLVANQSVKKLAQAAVKTHAKRAVVADESKYQELKDVLAGSGIEVAAGRSAVIAAGADDADVIVSAMVGAAGLEPTMAAVQAGKTVALANKESIVCAGSLVRKAVAQTGATLLPVDSEHNAIFQVFDANAPESIEKVIITASGGPFRTASLEEMRVATPAMALKHPNWSMGQRITIDSATMMNKGLEVIEASHFFPVSVDQLEVLVHPQSIVHGMVQYKDGALLAHMSPPDMRTPISHCLGYPERVEINGARLDLAKLSTLSFEEPDLVRFPGLRLGFAVARMGDMAGTVYNGADEVAVSAFLSGQIGFLDIVATVEETLEHFDSRGLLVKPGSLDDILELDKQVRVVAGEFASQRSSVL
ncbi:1-deoxy-D-xylulose-5-phosphate reductoisomerase [Rhodobacteraceae bacterium RKSG542]|uniref:1-deoxy-D-xylulose-5-phosphate reductoisomerase n=1 Tax=Pseudovibrio flavus TaxID=2529854 RepID=UPI0012BC1A7D|nr:1-deoxy-D-xylulose-5-phosphate reductoisomerase [Pseudovibrio flavus]